MELLTDLLGFMRGHRKFWLAPVVFSLIALRALVFSQGAPLAPFIYTLF